MRGQPPLLRPGHPCRILLLGCRAQIVARSHRARTRRPEESDRKDTRMTLAVNIGGEAQDERMRSLMCRANATILASYLKPNRK